MTKVQSKNAILFDIENDAGPLRDAMVATIGEGTALDPGLISAMDKAKLDGIAAGATANATDAALRDRATHTGEQAIGTITGLVDALAGKATPTDVAAALAGLVDSSPATLDTLNELAAALGDDPDFATTVSTALGNRLRVDAAQGLTAPQQAQGRDNLGLGSAALENAATFATAADLAAVGVRAVADRSAMLALPTSGASLAIVKDDARGGEYDWLPGDQSALVTADPGAVAVVPPTLAPSGASGVWLWRKMPRFTPRRAGAFGDVNGDNTSPDDWAAFQYAMNWAAYEGGILEVDRPYRIGQANKGRASNQTTQVGQLTLASNLYVEGHPDGRILPVGFSNSGSIITNLWTSTDARSLVSNVRMSGVVVDMVDYEPFVLRGTVEAATANTIKLPAIDADGRVTSTVDGWYNNLVLQIVKGPGQTEYVYLKNYVGATRTAEFLKPSGATPTLWDVTPDNTSLFELGFNDCAWGLSGGFYDGQFYDCEAYNVPLGILGAGGKGFNCENGVELVWIYGFYGENIGGANVFVQGHAGTNGNGSRRWVRKVIFRDFVGVDCGALIAVLGQDGSTDPDGNPDDNMPRFLNGFGERCGHMDQRISAEKAKNAGIILEEGANAVIENIVLDNGSWTPTYTTDDYRVGYGLTGMPHAIQGWARNVDIRNIWLYGNFASMYSLQRNRAFGGDAGPTGQPQNVYRVKIEDVKHQGVLDSYPVVVSATAGLRPIDAEVRITLKDFSFNSDPAAVFNPAMSIYTGIMTSGFSDWFNSRKVDTELSAKRFIELGNTVASVKARTSSKTFRRTATLSYDIASGGDIPAQGERSFTMTVSGVYLAENNSVYVTMGGAHVAGLIVRGEVTADNTVTVYVLNITTATKNTSGARSYTARVDTVIE